jgi:hypothetical protein
MDNTTPPQIPTESVRHAYSKHSDLMGHGTQYVRASANFCLVILGTLPVLVAGEGKNVSGGAPIQFALEKVWSLVNHHSPIYFHTSPHMFCSSG